MQWSNVIKDEIAKLKPIRIDQTLPQRLISLIDLTSLNESDTENDIAKLFEKARTSFGSVACVCVYPKFAALAATEFAHTNIKTATIANFPQGETALDEVLIEIADALEAGAQEIDVVFPYSRYLAGEKQYAHQFISACKAACGDDVLLKVILETGVLHDPAIIADAAYDALTSGADFIKTSTGKVAEGATLEAAAVMLLVIKHAQAQLKRPLGLKVSGGIREMEQAAQYVALADTIMGCDWVKREHFRIGASKLVDAMIKYMG